MSLTLYSLVHLGLASACLVLALFHGAFWAALRNKSQGWVAISLFGYTVFLVAMAAAGRASNGMLGRPEYWLLFAVWASFTPLFLLISTWSILGIPVTGWRRGLAIACAIAIASNVVHSGFLLTRSLAQPVPLWFEDHFDGRSLPQIGMRLVGFAVSICGVWDTVRMRRKEPALLAGFALAAVIVATEQLRSAGVLHIPSVLALTGLPYAIAVSAVMFHEYVTRSRAAEKAGEVGSYKLIRPLASGGMGELFLAARTAPGGFTRYVALKRMLEKGRGDGEWIERFLSEARIAASLSHPNIVAVTDLGRLSGGWYIVMEYLPGLSLAAVRDAVGRDGGRIPIPIALHIGEQIARGLAFAHSKGVIHRDVTPHNVMLTFDGAVKIVDFGIAKAAGAPETGGGSGSPSHSGELTLPGQVLGKVGYLSPEQQLGMPATAASDVFALGVVLHELLAGEKPQPTGPDEPPGVVPRVRALRPEVSEAVEAAVVKALARRANERYHRVDELELALRQALLAFPAPDLAEWLRGRFPREAEAANEEPSTDHVSLPADSRELETRRLGQA